jgi:hypothetical protein
VLPLLKGEGWGEVWDLSGEFAHLTLSLSFQEREPALDRFTQGHRHSDEEIGRTASHFSTNAFSMT